jgi:hypothetical protein
MFSLVKNIYKKYQRLSLKCINTDIHPLKIHSYSLYSHSSKNIYSNFDKKIYNKKSTNSETKSEGAAKSSEKKSDKENFEKSEDNKNINKETENENFNENDKKTIEELENIYNKPILTQMEVNFILILNLVL